MTLTEAGARTNVPGWAAATSAAGAVGVAAYVTAWVSAGVVVPGYAPLRQAISELFALGAPTASRVLVAGALVVTGVLLAACGPALHRGLPGDGLAGPVLVTLAGVGTLAVALFPCSDGCPGFGTSLTDSMHTITAGVGYVALVTAPLAFARRLRGHDARLATLSLVLGTIAVAGFVVRYGGLVAPLGGLQQRLFNTVADAWYVLAAVAVVRRWRGDAQTDAATG